MGAVAEEEGELADVAVALAGGHASAAMDVLRLHGRIKGSAAGALAQSVKAALALSVGARKADDAAAVLRGALRGLRDTHAASERTTRLEIEGLSVRLDLLEHTVRSILEIRGAAVA